MTPRLRFVVPMAVVALGIFRVGLTMSGHNQPLLPMPRWALLGTALLVGALALALCVQASKDGTLSQLQNDGRLSPRAIRLSLLTQGALLVMLLGMGSR